MEVDRSWYTEIINKHDSTTHWNSSLKKSICTYHCKNSWYDNFDWLEGRIYDKSEFSIIKVTREFKLFVRKLPRFVKTHHGDKGICLRILNNLRTDYFYVIEGHRNWNEKTEKGWDLRIKYIAKKDRILAECADIIEEAAD